MYRTRNPPVHTAAICIHMPPLLREVVENYAAERRISLGEAGRSLIEEGAKVLAAEDGRSWGWISKRIEADAERRERP